jgi:hypothetical protein
MRSCLFVLVYARPDHVTPGLKRHAMWEDTTPVVYILLGTTLCECSRWRA